MNKYLVILLLSSWTTITYSAEALITGEGEVLAAPDYVELTIQVDSECYPSANDARKENDAATRKIVDYLNSKIKKKDNYNTVISLGGYTASYHTAQQDKTICENTFQKKNTIIFRTQALENFDALFNDIQNTIYESLPGSPAIIKSSISYVTMSTPMPNVSATRRSQLEQQALHAAYQDAFSKLSALFGEHKTQNLKMVQASEVAPIEKPFLMKASSINMTQNVPVQFDEQRLHKIMYFKFTFDDIPLTVK